MKEPAVTGILTGAGLAGDTTAGAAGIAGEGVEAASTAQPGTTNTGEPRLEGGDQGGAAASKAKDMDTEMGEPEEEGGSSGSSSGSEDEGGSEEGEIDEGGGAGGAAGGATEGAPEVSVQPPSPDLLGNLESEIRGMEEGGPAE